MKKLIFPSIPRGLVAVGLAACAATTIRAAVASDIPAPDKRRATVETATRLSRPVAPAPLPAELPVPFNPPGFELSDAQEREAAAAAAGKASAVPKLSSDREILEEIGAKFPPSGAIIMGGEPILTFGKNRVKIGTHFTVTLNGQDYDLELVNADLTTFTLRLNREQIIRPIKPAKSP
jgi:hypothetical protein